MTVIHADFKSSKNLHTCIVPGSCSNASNYANANANAPKCPIDAVNLIKSGLTTEAKLKKEYPKEFNSWRSRRFFAKKHNIPFFNNWDVFSVFLTYIGLCPSEGFTIDRIKHELGYVPDNIRWSSKQEQSENRDIVIWLEYEGKRLTLTAWAMRTRQKPNTLLRRHKAGWDTQGIIRGLGRNGTENLGKPSSRPQPMRRGVLTSRRLTPQPGCAMAAIRRGERLPVPQTSSDQAC